MENSESNIHNNSDIISINGNDSSIRSCKTISSVVINRDIISAINSNRSQSLTDKEPDVITAFNAFKFGNKNYIMSNYPSFICDNVTSERKKNINIMDINESNIIEIGNENDFFYDKIVNIKEYNENKLKQNELIRMYSLDKQQRNINVQRGGIYLDEYSQSNDINSDNENNILTPKNLKNININILNEFYDRELLTIFGFCRQYIKNKLNIYDIIIQYSYNDIHNVCSAFKELFSIYHNELKTPNNNNNNNYDNNALKHAYII